MCFFVFVFSATNLQLWPSLSTKRSHLVLHRFDSNLHQIEMVYLVEVFGHKPSVLRSHVGDRQMEVGGGGKTWHYDEKPEHQRRVI